MITGQCGRKCLHTGDSTENTNRYNEIGNQSLRNYFARPPTRQSTATELNKRGIPRSQKQWASPAAMQHAYTDIKFQIRIAFPVTIPKYSHNRR